jgi:hypothetical protein
MLLRYKQTKMGEKLEISILKPLITDLKHSLILIECSSEIIQLDTKR